MIKIEGSDIGFIDVMDLDIKQDLKKKIKKHLLDLIIDCSKTIPDKSFLSEIRSFQKTHSRCFVIIIPIEKKINYPESWDLVPTKQEALDFISFEQMQRELGF